MANHSFDIVSKADLSEVQNAVQMVMKEVRQRFDFKGSASNVSLEDGKLVLVSDDDYKLRALRDVMDQKLVKRGVSLKALSFGRAEKAAGGTVRQVASIQQGIPIEKAKEISKLIRDSKLKVQASIQGDLVRVSGRDKDSLQKIIATLREKEFGIDLQFANYRSH